MTLVYDEKYIVLITGKDENHIIDKGLSEKVVLKKSFESIFLYFLEKGNIDLIESQNHNSPIKVLDRFFLFLPSNDPDKATLIISCFFDFISKYYDHLITIERNFLNIRYLLDYLIKKQKKDNPLILDFGCGIGLSAKIGEEYWVKGINVSLIGFDISKPMRSLANRAGLKTINEQGLLKLKDNSLDGIFASYAFHFIQQTDIFKLLWNKLRIGGCIIGNFHKNISVTKVLNAIKELNGDIQLVEENEHGSIYVFRKQNHLFIDFINAKNYLLDNDITVDDDLIPILIRNNILTEFLYNEQALILKNDLELLLNFFRNIISATWIHSETELYPNQYKIVTPGLIVIFKKTNSVNLSPSTISLLKNILCNYSTNNLEIDSTPITLDAAITIDIKYAELINYFKSHIKLIKNIDESRASIFANTASYMGSKKTLRSFIVESISNHINKNYAILDIMCGSGAVSGALAMEWHTHVSDAMKFCEILATVQGGGFNVEKANKLIEFIKIECAENLESLKKIFKKEIAIEDEIFHSEITDELIKKYSAFCDIFPSTEDKNSLARNLYNEAKGNKSHFPYSLFTCLYSNLYLGVAQAIELDSVRYAINKIPSEADRKWALGALIATLSALSNNYGGHFAQPKYDDISNLSTKEIYNLIEKRVLSIKNEFIIRLREFALESQTNNSFEIRTFEGPWQNALKKERAESKDKNTIVYLDAPYTREEYSRYYHLFETLVNYDYPPFSGKGRIADKKSGNRFRSDFFTRNTDKLKSVYTEIILAILNSGFLCAWSYSDNASVPCVEILYEIGSKINCSFSSYATPYTHQAQGGKKAKKIKEILIVMRPNN
jgi:adenine-specific DNA-methyltransferase